MLSPGYLFVGSRLGDSVLLQYTREEKTTSIPRLEPVTKQRKATFWDNSKSLESEQRIDDDFELLYGDENSMDTDQVLDSWLSHKPNAASLAVIGNEDH